MRVVAWVGAGTWPAVVAAVRGLPAADVQLVAVADRSESVPHAMLGGLLGRGDRGKQVPDQLTHDAAQRVLDQAAGAMGRECEVLLRVGLTEREVTSAAAGADLLVLARDGDRSRLGPSSLGRHTRFVVDHAPCSVLLVWPEEAPGVGTIPPPPPDRDRS